MESINSFSCSSAPHRDPERFPFEVLTFSSSAFSTPATPHSVTRRYSWILLPWQRRGLLVCQVGVRLAFLRWHRRDNVSVCTPADTSGGGGPSQSNPLLLTNLWQYLMAYHEEGPAGQQCRDMSKLQGDRGCMKCHINTTYMFLKRVSAAQHASTLRYLRICNEDSQFSGI